MVEGYIYVSGADPGPMATAVVGARVAKDTVDPPWIVVDHTLERVIVARWPGRLFRVALVAPRTDEERRVLARIGAELVPDAGYTRALAVDVLEELPPALLFGPYGDAVAEVAAAGGALTEDVARQLAAARPAGAAAAYDRAWKRWLSAEPHRAGGLGAPVGAGFSVVHRAVWESAERRGGPGAVLAEDDELVLAPPWAEAASALCHAAMARGAPDLCGDEDAAVLTAAWRAVFGGDGR